MNASVLIVDDEPLILRFLISCLESAHCRQLEQARCAEAARSLMARHSISLLVADVFLPDGDGRDLAREFLELNPEGQVLLMTGFSEGELVVPPQLLGHVEVLEKPFPSHQLLEVLARCSQKITSPPAVPRAQSAPQTHLAAAGC